MERQILLQSLKKNEIFSNFVTKPEIEEDLQFSDTDLLKTLVDNYPNERTRKVLYVLLNSLINEIMEIETEKEQEEIMERDGCR